VNLPTPAIVAERGAQPLPRLALLLFCAAYVLPGLFGRDPWRNADLSSFGFMASIAEGHAPWWTPAIAGIPAEGGPLPYWVGALAIKCLPFFDAAFAARLPFALILALILVLVWYSSFHLASTAAAQPVAFAFGGEAHSVDYARALADGALLALIASLGLLQLGHETTPELLQLLAVSLYLYGLAAAPYRVVKSRWATLFSLPILAASGAPAIALGFAGFGALLCKRSSYVEVRALMPSMLAAGLLAALSAWEFNAWAWRIGTDWSAELPLSLLNLIGWFCWPAWPLAMWALWRWRTHWQHRHILVPLVLLLIPLLTSMLMGGSDRALLLSLPAMAVLAAFALPTLRRGMAAAIDWFSVFFFSVCALFFWVYYVSMHLGWPATPLSNLRRLAEGFEPVFNGVALGFAVLASAAWLALVRWRTSRHRHALWKSLVLPAGGVALNWMLIMTLLLPPLNYARSNQPLVERLRVYLPADADCIAAPNQALSTLAALEFQGGWRVRSDASLVNSPCSYALQGELATVPSGWLQIASVGRPTDRVPSFAVLRRR
jgi:4-amino-4-deoxy-L-arabinose transferase-like glycosyltransferase